MLPDPEHPQEAALLAFALSYPEAYQDFPWGERALKVRSKVFVFAHRGEAKAGEAPGSYLGLSVKVPEWAPYLVAAGEAVPTGYGLGRSGWITMRFRTTAREGLPLERLKALVDRSYRNVAPRTLVKGLGPALEDPGLED